MDTNNFNGADGKSGSEKGWEDSSYSWEQMQGGIFEKIQVQDPDFFKKDRKRRPVWLFWLTGLVVLVGGVVFWSIREGDPASTEPSGNEQKGAPSGGIAHTATVPFTFIQEPCAEEALPAQDRIATPAASPKPVDKIPVAEKAALAPAAQQQVASISGESPGMTTFSLVPPISALPLDELALTLAELPTSATGNPHSRPVDRRPWTFILDAGGVFSSFNYNGASPIAEFRNQRTDAYMGFQVGLRAHAPLGEQSFLSMGLEQEFGYQYLDVYIERDVEVTHENILLSVTHYLIGERSAFVYGDTTLNGVEKTRLAQYNEFVSTRLSLGWGMELKKANWQVRPRIALKGGWLNRASGRTIAEDFSVQEFNKANPLFSQWQLMSSAGVDVGRKLTDRLGLFLGYQIDKQWNNASLEEDLSLRPVFHRLSAGVTLNW